MAMSWQSSLGTVHLLQAWPWSSGLALVPDVRPEKREYSNLQPERLYFNLKERNKSKL